MDIRYLTYFVTIVDSGFNISNAAKDLYITQSALSKCVRYLEDNYSPLFLRSRGRLIALTKAGDCLYKNAKAIIHSYDVLLKELESCSSFNISKLTIGIPPFVVSVLFSSVLNELYTKYPSINFKVIELGANKLQEMLLSNEIDMAVLLSPTQLDEDVFVHETLYSTDLKAFLAKSNPLANQNLFEWSTFDNQTLSLLDDTFMITRLITEKLKEKNVHVKDTFFTSQWDLAINAVNKSDMITIMPSILDQTLILGDIVSREINHSLKYVVQLVYNKNNFGKTMHLTRDCIVEHFNYT